MNKFKKKKIKYSLLFYMLLGIQVAFSQDYRLDNKLYKTISWNDFFDKLERNPKLVFYDIRTDGERMDTSQYIANNQGRIRGAKQMDYFQVGKYYPNLLKHKEDTIYLYCSHSMRSRRLAKQLADSSFHHVISVDGGMSFLNLMGNKTFPLKKKYYETSLTYKLVSPLNLAGKLKNKNVQIIDVRPDSIYYATGGDEQDLSYGSIKGLKHIDPSKCIDSLRVFNPNKEIVLIDNYGDISPLVAKKLIEKGYKNVSVLHYGLDDLVKRVPSTNRKYLKTKYAIITAEELLLIKDRADLAIIDIRSESEFNSKDTLAYKNVGRLKNAINIPFNKISAEALAPFKNKQIVIFDYRMLSMELYKAADVLAKNGHSNFSILAGGIFQVIWLGANTNNKELKTIVSYYE